MSTPSQKKRRSKGKDGAVAPVGLRLNRLGRASPREAAGKPVYLAVEHDDDQEVPAHSIVELGGGGGGGEAHLVLHNVRGMSFATVESRYGPRIVGVGGKLFTTVYDPKTSMEIPGPFLVEPKLRPVLIPRGSKLYALSRTPSVVPGLDFLPWFVYLDLNYVLVAPHDARTMGWHHLPPPPIFPVRLNPLEYRDPPEVRVASYAVVGSHILLSVQQDKGTCAFDMDTNQWDMVDANNLPFIGKAVPLGGHLFIARSIANGGAAAVYDIRVFPLQPTSSGSHKTELSILNIPVVSKGIVPGQLFCSLGKGIFSSIDVRSAATPGPDAKLHKARIVHRTYSQVGGDDTEDNNYTVITKQHRQIYKLIDRTRHLAHPSPVVAALTM
ncbi:hypothetical protein OsJ_00374 [Oryza sativa Japonica Group]|nr:hypothetical protein OsJ_00374 [Oryza sativa Japonica Group]